MAEITVLKIAPGKHPAKTKLQSTIEAFNRAVSVGAVEIGKACTKKMEKDIYILYNYYGCLDELPGNRQVNGEIITGTFYVLGATQGYRPRSLTPHEIERYSSLFWEPEVYSDTDIIKNSMDMLYDSLVELEKL